MGYKNNKKKFKPIKPLEVVSADDPKTANAVKDPTILPNTFKFAADALRTMSERGGSVGSIVVKQYKSYNFKLIYALVMNTVKNIKIIKKIIHNLKLMSSIKESNPFLIEIMVGDFLFGQGLKSVEKNPIAVAIKDRKDAIAKEQSALKKEFSSDMNDEMAKYLRINHLKCDMNYVISQLKAVGLTNLEYSKDKIKFKKFVNKYKTMEDNQFMIDFHFPNDLIVLKPKAAKRLNSLDLLKHSKATFQDKASFMAVEALDVKPGQNIIDACFAPGGKTSLIATKMRNKGKILAYDKDKGRLISAIRFLKLQGVTNVKSECVDFSSVKLRRLPKNNNVKQFDSILLDPSCSGSGIQSRVDYKKNDAEAGRLKKLQAFQVSLLKHALKASVSKTIVYCTCSTSTEENEQVVEMALEESGVKDKWQVVDALPYWSLRGDSKFEFGEKCLRSSVENLTNGFFIAKLEYNESGSKAVASNGKKSDEARPDVREMPKRKRPRMETKMEGEEDDESAEGENDESEDEEEEEFEDSDEELEDEDVSGSDEEEEDEEEFEDAKENSD